ncbi:MAG: GNAT family N-acetyltransferase [Acidobacteriota bacterium]|nr:MAG: GNAT family N-acetyltransferase [Acidobacteriota bacterium]
MIFKTKRARMCRTGGEVAEFFNVRILRPEEAPALVALRREALESCPQAFASSLDDDRGLSIEYMQEAMSKTAQMTVFGLFDGGTLTGMTGLFREPKSKACHKAHIWGMYVRPGVRRRGGGMRLLNAAIDHARSWSGVVQVHLSVSESARAAQALYQRAGFVEWGREPRALRWQGEFLDERHLVLDLCPDETPA